MKDDIYSKPFQIIPKFEFSEKVAQVFDDMIHRSVPFYETNQTMSCQMAEEFYTDGSIIYDLGCSTGKTAQTLSQVFENRPFQYIGIDNSSAMIDKAEKSKNDMSEIHKIDFLLGDIETFPYGNAGIIIANYTFQFIPPEKRAALLNNIYFSLNKNGVLLLSEKVVESDKEIANHFIHMHHLMKKACGYSDLEIMQKRDAIEDVLIPNTPEKNMELMKDAGFQAVSIYHKWFNFASYIALKK
ncbi:MAG: carboxy-S-adenosyl-L-methionine synthase CmoA [Spirochaetia bacterium]|nr:carboxy-S-adenosyl-L-methionine synthase CmoA [Spirochaetia bacterium]